MGHYDNSYADEHERHLKAEKDSARRQLALIEGFRNALVSGPGTRGISARHLDALQDFINETKLRAM